MNHKNYTDWETFKHNQHGFQSVYNWPQEWQQKEAPQSHKLLHISASEVRCTLCDWSLDVPIVVSAWKMSSPRAEAVLRKDLIRKAFESHITLENSIITTN